MASIGEIVGHLQATLDRINDAVTSIDAADSGAGQLQDVFTHAGVEDKATQLSLVHEAVNQLRQGLQGCIGQANKCISLTRGVGG